MTSDTHTLDTTSITSAQDQGTSLVRAKAGSVRPGGLYAWYVLIMLVVVSVFNFIDRQILAILAEDIKADLGLSDGDLGFLFGTAFAVFYAVFGIPLARLADCWVRTRLISISVGFWSAMTALSGTAQSFLSLAICRFGVGVGEAGASPAALSILYDYFPKKMRTTVMGIYAGGVAIGVGLGLFLGGAILDVWKSSFPNPELAPFGLKGWQVAFMVVGIPGLFLAIWVNSLREPKRGVIDGYVSHKDESLNLSPIRNLLSEMAPMIPFYNLFYFQKIAKDLKPIYANTIVLVAFVIIAITLVKITGDTLQWLALTVGMYCVFSWIQSLSIRDPVCFGLIFKCKSVCCLYLHIGLLNFGVVGVNFWLVPYFQRFHGADASEVGFVLGIMMASGGLLGMILGGITSDYLRRYTQKGKLYVALGAFSLWIVSYASLLIVDSKISAYTLGFIGMIAGAFGTSSAPSTLSDLMLPRVRATAMALYIMTMNFMGFALGPYCIGKVSDLLVAAGTMPAIALQTAIFSSFLLPVAALGVLLIVLKNLVEDEDSITERARFLGEEL